MHKVKPNNKLNLLLSVIFISIFVACTSNAQTETTRIILTVPSVGSSESIAEEVEITVTSTITPTPRIPTSTPITNETGTPIAIPTVPSFARTVSNLPISGSVLAVSADGTLVAVSDFATDVLLIFDVIEQSMKWKLVEDSGSMTGNSPITFSPDGNFLAAGGVEQDLFIWNMNNGEVIHRISHPYSSLSGLSFSPDSTLLAISSIDKFSTYEGVRIYDMTTGEQVDTFPSPSILVYPPSANGDKHFLEPFNRYGEIWEAVFLPNQPKILAIAVNPYGLSQEENNSGGVYLWDIEAKELREELTGGFISAMTISPNGRFLVAYINNELHGWDIEQDRKLFVQNVGDVYLPKLTLTNSGLLATLTGEGIVGVWNIEGELLTNIESDNPITDIAFTPEGNLLVAFLVGNNSPIEIWKFNE